MFFKRRKKEKHRYVVLLCPQEIKDIETSTKEHGFSNESEFIKAAVRWYIRKHNSNVTISEEAIKSIKELIEELGR